MLDFVTEKVKFKFDGIAHEVFVSNVEQNLEFTKQYNVAKEKNDPSAIFEVIYNYLEVLGLDKTIAKKFNQQQLNILLEKCSNPDTKKK